MTVTQPGRVNIVGVPALLNRLARGQADARANMSETLSPNDEMLAFKGDATGYFYNARTALSCITAAMVLAGKDDAGTILDLPCGHGRVMRMLRPRFPDARIVGCDLLTDGVDFCAAEFGAVPVYSRPRPADIPIDETFDLIWVGSLFSHLEESLWHEFLAWFIDRLAPHGLLVFTTCGRFLVNTAPFEPVRQEYQERGFAWRELDAMGRPGYGMTAVSPAWVAEEVSRYDEVRLLAFWERGWADRQDVVALVKRPVDGHRTAPILI